MCVLDFYFTSWILAGVSLIINYFFLIWSIKLAVLNYLGLRSKTTKATERLGTPSYCLFLDTLWKIFVSSSLEYTNLRTQLALSSLKDYEHKRCVYCIFFSLCGAYQALVCLVIACSWSGVLKLATYKYLGIRSKTTKVIFDSFNIFQKEVRYFGKRCQTLRQLWPEKGESLAKF